MQKKILTQQEQDALLVAKTKSIVKLAVILIVTLLASLSLDYFGLGEENILLIYLLAVLLVVTESKSFIGGIVAAVVGILVFNFFFTEPRLSFRVYDPAYIITFIIFFSVAFIANTLTTKLQQQIVVAEANERNANLLFEFSTGFLTAHDKDSIIHHALVTLDSVLETKAVIYLSEDGLHVSETYQSKNVTSKNLPGKNIAEWTLANESSSNMSDSCYSYNNWLYLLLQNVDRKLGVVAMQFSDDEYLERKKFLVEMIMSQLALVLAREALHSSEEKLSILLERESSI